MRILLAEDDGLIALAMEDLLEDLGCEVACSAATLAKALAWLEAGGEPDAAIIDLDLDGEPAIPLAEALAARRTPFAFATGSGAPPPRFAAAPALAKPVRRERLAEVLEGFARVSLPGERS